MAPKVQTKLKKHLESNGLKATWLGMKTGINYDRLLRIINGSEPTVSEAIAICRELRKETHELFEIKEVENSFTS